MEGKGDIPRACEHSEKKREGLRWRKRRSGNEALGCRCDRLDLVEGAYDSIEETDGARIYGDRLGSIRDCLFPSRVKECAGKPCEESKISMCWCGRDVAAWVPDRRLL